MRSIHGQLPASVTTSGPRSRRVLALVGDSQVGLWITRSLGRAGLEVLCVCVSEDNLSGHSRYASGVWIAESGPGDAGFAEQIKRLASELDVGSIITVAEPYHRAVIFARDLFEPDIHVFSPPRKAFEHATDKDYTHALCLSLRIPVARGTTLDRLFGEAGIRDLTFPLVLRTRSMYGAQGGVPWKAAYAETPQQLENLYRDVQTFADNVLVQEYHPGVEDHVQVLMHKGEPFMVGEYIGEHHMPLAGGVTVQRVTCRHEDVINDAVRLLKAIAWEGIAGVQFHYDPKTGKYIFLEINPRFIGGLPTVIRAGFDAPFLLWQSHFEPEKMRQAPYRLGLRTRILGGDANWMLGMIRGDPLPPGQKRLSKVSAISRFLWNCGPWTRDDTFWWRDPRPFWVDLRSMARKLRERSVDLIGNPKSQQDTP